MKDKYINRLIEKLGNTVFKEHNEIVEYTEGIGILVDHFMDLREQGGKLFFIGNGGSAAIASHMTADYMKNGGIRTCNLYDNAVLTCLANDYGYDRVFSKQLEKLGTKGDILLVISSSGESDNIVKALETASVIGMRTISFTGFSENNKARKVADISIYVPCDMYGVVESIHTIILQEIVDIIIEEDG